VKKKFKIFIFSLFTFHLSLFTFSDAKIYIDITSPLRKLPISIISTGPSEAKEIEGIVKNDLEFTGIFLPVDPDAPDAEISVNIKVEVSNKLKASLIVSDLIKNTEILTKRYEASRDVIRALAHSISNDVFRIVTGREGIFRTKLAYIVDSSGKKEIHLMDWDGHNSMRLISKGFISSHCWSYDGQYIVYSSERNRMWGIYLLDLRNYVEKRLFLSEGLNLVGSISADNHMVFSSSKEGSPEIYIMNIDKRSYKKLTRSLGIDVSPVFSPDGSQVAFVSDRGGTPQIYIMDVEGKGLKRITFEGNYNTSPAWSPNGKWIAFVGRKNGKNQIFMIKSDGTELKQLTDSGNNESPTFSPDGLFIAFDSDRDGNRGIYIMRINGEGQKRITPKHIKAMAPKWSPYLREVKK
jgi:TolB protein